MLAKVKKFIERNAYQHYVLLCSAGIDSMVMLDIFHRLGLVFSVIHVDYSLRRNESKEDANFVHDRCRRLGVPFYLLKVDLKQRLDENGGNLQQVARKIRYNYLEKILTSLPNSIGVSAHHADDQIETFWLHAIRGSGLSGLSGMDSSSPTLLRPFLSIERSTILYYAKKQGISWREDSSNNNTKYLRNLLRNEALPRLYQSHPKLRCELQFLMKKLKQTHQSHRKMALKLARTWNNTHEIPHADLALDPSILVEALKAHSIAPRYLKPITELGSLAPGKQLHIENNLLLIQTNNALKIQTNESLFVRIEFQEEIVACLPERFDLWTWYLNPEQLHNPLSLDGYSDKDSFRPNGLSNEKSINAILKAARIPHHERIHWPIFRCGDAIVGIPGIALAHSFRANFKGTSFLKITFIRW